MTGYPIELKLSGKVAVVIGLGAVGRRRAAGLREAGARVIGIDPAAGGFDSESLAGIEIIAEAYRAEHLHGASLAIAAAWPEVNRQVVADARAAGVWVNSASEPEASDFSLPAVWRSGSLILTVSTSGASPALATALRDRAAEALGPSAAGLATLLAELRPLVLARVTVPEARHAILEDWANPRWLELWADQGPDIVRQALLERIEG
ncbi:MAG TPA: bifunctional precorrin-2 dehydrogenase/sirohydrochlorin ferrochelatase [Isosphaeraceae bacterium]|nr:bifunctional precorrin-2 dehydrogenase/sirohydrochlorin ferrochelatase [Isosphaeraceae bacterium]